MNEQELVQIQITMGVIFKQINALPLDDYIKRLDRSLTIAPFIDPTLWINKQEDANRMLRIARAFRICRDSIDAEFIEGKGGY